MGKDALPGRNPPPHGVPLPKAVVGVSGIYDLVGLDERHTGYTGFIESAFGEEKSGWRRSSPALYTGNFATNWPSRKLALLAWSQNDSLIDEPEIDSMATKLTRDGVKPLVLKNLTGDHDDVWREGVQLRMLLSDALRILSVET
jgi:kynurenine formamidase